MENSKDLNRCLNCNDLIAISGSGIMFCPNDNCEIEVIGKLEYTSIDKLSEPTIKSETSKKVTDSIPDVIVSVCECGNPKFVFNEVTQELNCKCGNRIKIAN